MSDLSATPYLHNMPSTAQHSGAGLATTSSNSDLLQNSNSVLVNAGLFQAPTASDTNVLDVQPAAGPPSDADTHARYILAFVGSR